MSRGLQTIAESARLAWVAGLLDGEGCFGIYPNGRGYTATLRVNMTSLVTVQRLRSVLGGVGSLNRNGPRAGRKPSYTWCLSRKPDLLRILESVKPYLVGSLPEANVLLAFLRGGNPELLYRISHELKTRRKPLKREAA